MKLSTIKTQPTIYVLVGLPASGKSTWIRENMDPQNFVIVSSDDEIDKHAKSKGLTYSDVFDSYIKTATKIMNETFRVAISERKSIIWDQTNMTIKKRKNILSQVPRNYGKIAVVFRIDDDELDRRLLKRAQDEGKHIPQHVIQSMAKSFEMPTTEEGFDKVITNTNIEILQ